MDKYQDRYAAGKILAEQLKPYAKNPNVIVLALPRGGVPIAYEIANTLSLPLDIFIVRKLGVPGHEELAMGAIAAGGTAVFNDDVIHDLHISKQAIEQVAEEELQELKRREKKYRDNRPFPNITGKTVILVDDGIATGATMRAAIQALRQLNPASIIMAIPVAEITTYEKMATLVDKIICPLKPKFFNAVGSWYETFNQTSDEEVLELMNKIK